MIDQAFWQYAAILHDRLDAPVFVSDTFTEPAQIIRLGEDHVGLLMPWLDELVALSLDDENERFHRMQVLWSSAIDRIAPHINVTDHRVSSSQRAHTRPVHPRVRRFAPVRSEAITVREALEAVDAGAFGGDGAFVHPSSFRASLPVPTARPQEPC